LRFSEISEFDFKVSFGSSKQRTIPQNESKIVILMNIYRLFRLSPTSSENSLVIICNIGL
jgi:hypothetical protein